MFNKLDKNRKINTKTFKNHSICTVVHKKKKNAEHTRMYTNFSHFSSQYSRRLLSILAQHQQLTNPTQSIDFNRYFNCVVGFVRNDHCKTILIRKAKRKKKCGAHTHAHHLSQLSYQYSRRLLSILAQLHKKTNKQKTGVCYEATPILFVSLRSLIIRAL